MDNLITTGSYVTGNEVNLKAPQSWRELSQKQLRYVFFLLSHFQTMEEVKTYMLLRFTGFKVVRKTPSGVYGYIRNNGRGKRHYFELKTWQIQSLIHQFDYIDSYDDMGVRLDRIRGYRAVDVILKDVAFIDYLNMERLYQLFISTKERKHIVKLACLLYRDKNVIRKLFRLLYRGKKGNPAKIKLDETEEVAVLYWFGYIKAFFGKMFPHFFKPATGNEQGRVNFLKIANAQLRVLTDGDVTKEKTVEQIPCLRALTELNEKAREAEEFKRKYNK